ncbi:Alcohol dehydrogenase [cytochrome c] precursor [Novipirellula aureliae]|uniref:Alcohol dehydrogenase [cytochrome c] n=1 Tax=Novipirellula aureliae TaxID=2527966 RepID=A0A5C6DGW2_9BACT|nr:PQQ-binding-like beta-propeller repeat protein [Novipirellula aureliae]TWU35234.1 Alcohol dehydrogenase [cytochrome c] precursor [Novipirellula aureliae]
MYLNSLSVRSCIQLLLTIAMVPASFVASASDDWPMWRSDAQRSAASTNRVSDAFRLLWQREFTQRVPAWDDPLNLDLMTYDRIFEPIVMDGRMFVGFNDQDKLLALDASTGRELWSFVTEAPVRLPPVGWQGKVYFCSDDGFLYCVDAAAGTLEWKFSGAPNTQHVIGNQRLSSAWPARGGPVVRDGRVYFAASIWPFMGTFIYALDAESGEIQWLNDRTGAQYIKQPHNAPSFAGVAPQGALVATESELIVPGGRSVPAVFDRATGELRYFELNAGGKGTGGSFVAATGDRFYVHTREKGTRAFQISTGKKTAFMPNEPVLNAGIVYSAELADDQPMVRAFGSDDKLIWEIAADGSGDLILAGDKLIAAGNNQITAIRLPAQGEPAKIVFQLPCEEPIERLLVASEKLFAVTLDGKLLAFGENARSSLPPVVLPAELPAELPANKNAVAIADETDRQVVQQMLGSSAAEGYAFWYGSTDSRIARSLASESPFKQLAMVDSDLRRVHQMREQLESQGIQGVTVHHANAADFRAPQYVGHMVFIAPDCVAEILHEMTAGAASAKMRAVDNAPQTIRQSETLAGLYQTVRPYGGTMHLLFSDRNGEEGVAEIKVEDLVELVDAQGLEKAKVEIHDYGVCIRRVGALPGSSNWTHQYGDVANTLKSNDSRVKLPLGVLWFGGNSNMDVLPRHGHGPPEQVVDGRLYIQGMNSLSCRDVYTGRVVWKRDFGDLGTFDVYFDTTYEDSPLDPKYNQVHIPGANARGTNYVVTEDRVYMLVGNACLALDPLTGQTLHQIELPRDDNGDQPEWGYIGVYEDVLIGGLGFAKYRERHELEFESDKSLKLNKAGFGSKSFDRAASIGLIGFDRHTGEQKWQVMARHSFWHNGIVAGAGKLYCLDKNPSQVEQALLRRGQPEPDDYRILALDYRTGQTVWEIEEGVFGTWLGYSPQFDMLLHAGAEARDRLVAETGHGMTVYHATDGTIQWQNPDLEYSGPCILHNDWIITNANSYTESAGAFHLLSGKQKMVKNPLTGELQPWRITRAYGCNSIIASENMLTFRSGAAGFYDLLTEGGTGNLGGFKSGCTSNLVVANGVLNAPDYTRTCSCAYQNQTSLALVHMPDIDVWTIDLIANSATPNQLLERLSLNFGAPGHRRQPDGQLWMEYPVMAGDSIPIDIETNAEAKPFQHHSSLVKGVDRPWVLASGLEDLTELRIGMRIKSPPVEAGANKSKSKKTDTTSKAKAAVSQRDEPRAETTAAEVDAPVHSYDVRLHFSCSPIASQGRRVFDVYAQDQLVLSDVAIDPAGDVGQQTAEHLLEKIPIAGDLRLRFVPKQGTAVLSGIEIEKR